MCEQCRTLELCVSGMNRDAQSLASPVTDEPSRTALAGTQSESIGDSQASNNDKACGFAGVLLHLWKPDCTDFFLGSYMHMGRQQVSCRTQRFGGRVTVWGPPLQHRFGRSYFC